MLGREPGRMSLAVLVRPCIGAFAIPTPYAVEASQGARPTTGEHHPHDMIY